VIKSTTTFKEAEELLGHTEAWRVVDEATRRTMFDSFISQIQAMGDRDGEDYNGIIVNRCIVKIQDDIVRIIVG
jgi:hypothetical protein